jgi:hypothetical protein
MSHFHWVWVQKCLFDAEEARNHIHPHSCFFYHSIHWIPLLPPNVNPHVEKKNQSSHYIDGLQQWACATQNKPTTTEEEGMSLLSLVSRQTPCGSHQRVCRAEIANISSLWFPSHLWSEANLSVRKAVSWSKPSEGWRDTAKTANIKFSGQITPFDLEWIGMLVLENPLHFSRYSWRAVSIASGLWIIPHLGHY